VQDWLNEHPVETTGWTDCGCNAGFIGGVVLDPFVGSGTTCEVAYHLGRTAIGIDASAKYLDMAKERVKQGALL
jgi:2-polyprenyl-3-methyl-5-hydroxy-6-metoxy-1,4-benzoquinol methylase